MKSSKREKSEKNGGCPVYVGVLAVTRLWDKEVLNWGGGFFQLGVGNMG